MKSFAERLSLSILSSFIAIFSLHGCQKNSTEPETTPQALTIEAPATSIYAGGALQLRAKIAYDDGATEDVTATAQWSTQSGSKGDISSAGLFTAWNDALGSESIHAFYKGLRTELKIEITPRAVTLASWPVITTVRAGASQQFDITAQFHNTTAAFVTGEASWELRPAQAGSIGEDGLFRAQLGMAGAETLRVTYQELSVESFIQVAALAEAPVTLTHIPSAAFMMGDDNGQENERPAHQITLSDFEIGTFEVSNDEYVRYLNDAFRLGEITYSSGVIAAKKGPYAGFIYAKILGSEQYPQQHILFIDHGDGTGAFETVPGFENRPVVRVDWYGAMAYCRFYGLRLPTEAEWEMACRGGRQFEYGTATGEIDHDLANYEGFGGRDRFVAPAPVGSFPANPYGLYDMSGNVSEYVSDVYQVNYYTISPSVNPRGPGPSQVLGRLPGGLAIWRGGAWVHPPQMLRAAMRGVIFDQTDNSQLAQSTIGFRVARSLQ